MIVWLTGMAVRPSVSVELGGRSPDFVRIVVDISNPPDA